MICNCFFYGRHLLVKPGGDFGLLVETGGNQCAMIEHAHAPCRMVEPDWPKCPLKKDPLLMARAEAGLWSDLSSLTGIGTTVLAVEDPLEVGQIIRAAAYTFKLTLQITAAEFRHTRAMHSHHGRLENEESLQGMQHKSGEFVAVDDYTQPGPEYIYFWRAERIA